MGCTIKSIGEKLRVSTPVEAAASIVLPKGEVIPFSRRSFSTVFAVFPERA
jgi:hypothetical protein